MAKIDIYSFEPPEQAAFHVEIRDKAIPDPIKLHLRQIGLSEQVGAIALGDQFWSRHVDDSDGKTPMHLAPIGNRPVRPAKDVCTNIAMVFCAQTSDTESYSMEELAAMTIFDGLYAGLAGASVRVQGMMIPPDDEDVDPKA